MEKAELLKVRYLEPFMYTQGQNLIILVLLITMFTKHNWSSIVYFLFFIRLLSIGLHPHRVTALHDDSYKSRQKVMYRFLTIMIFFITCLLMLEYTTNYVIWVSKHEDEDEGPPLKQ